MPAEAPAVAIVGGGLAGLSAAAALGSEGYAVTVFESRPFLGGRASSYVLPNTDESIDNCQHVLLRCCHNLLDFYGRLRVADKVQFHREFYWIEPGGRTSVMRRGALPAPAHFTESFVKLKFLSLRDKVAVARGLLAVRAEYRTRHDLDRITMMEWLREKGQTDAAIERFWRQVLVSAINEDLEIMAASHGLQVFYSGFLNGARSYEMGIPTIPLSDLYSPGLWQHMPGVRIRPRVPVESLEVRDNRVVQLNGSEAADAYVLALPFERTAKLLPDLPIDHNAFEHSPITGIHLWFDRPVTSLPHATLLDRTIQWMFNKSEGKHIQLVVSASRKLTEVPRAEVIANAVRELAEFLPAVREANLDRAHVVKEVRATFSAKPGLEDRRPVARTKIENLFLAGDWTRSGWPATMEGAVRSGYLAAEAVCAALGNPRQFLLPS